MSKSVWTRSPVGPRSLCGTARWDSWILRIGRASLKAGGIISPASVGTYPALLWPIEPDESRPMLGLLRRCCGQSSLMPGDLDAVWKALSDTTRRAILDLLREGPDRKSVV